MATASAEDEPAVLLAAEGLRRAGYEPTTAFSGGGADANVFNERGLPCVNLANGMVDIHTPDERIAVADLEGMVEVTLAIVDAARAADVALTLRWGTVTAVTAAARRAHPLRGRRRRRASPTRGRRAGRARRHGSRQHAGRDLDLGSGGFDILYANLTRGLALPPTRRHT